MARERDDDVALSSAAIRRLTTHAAALARMHGLRGPAAVITTGDVDYRINRLLSAYAETAGYEINLFRTMAAAVRWISTVHR